MNETKPKARRRRLSEREGQPSTTTMTHHASRRDEVVDRSVRSPAGDLVAQIAPVALATTSTAKMPAKSISRFGIRSVHRVSLIAGRGGAKASSAPRSVREKHPCPRRRDANRRTEVSVHSSGIGRNSPWASRGSGSRSTRERTRCGPRGRHAPDARRRQSVDRSCCALPSGNRIRIVLLERFDHLRNGVGPDSVRVRSITTPRSTSLMSSGAARRVPVVGAGDGTRADAQVLGQRRPDQHSPHGSNDCRVDALHRGGGPAP